MDGCSTNAKLGRLLEKLTQFCLAHAFQLAITKTLYKKVKAGNVDEQLEVITEAYEDKPADEMSFSEEEIEDGDEVDSGNEIEMGLYVETLPSDIFLLKETKYEEAINKLRKIINHYCGRSTVRHDNFQNAVKE